MFEISKYKKSNVKISIRLPEIDEMDLSKYKDIELYDNKELKI